MKKPILHAVKTEPKEPAVKIDHAGEIETLVGELKGTSPSGVETIAAKIMEHVKAWKHD